MKKEYIITIAGMAFLFSITLAVFVSAVVKGVEPQMSKRELIYTH